MDRVPVSKFGRVWYGKPKISKWLPKMSTVQCFVLGNILSLCDGFHEDLHGISSLLGKVKSKMEGFSFWKPNLLYEFKKQLWFLGFKLFMIELMVRSNGQIIVLPELKIFKPLSLIQIDYPIIKTCQKILV